MKIGQHSGFALLLVLWTLVILSAVALSLAATVGAEMRSTQDSWNDLQADRLAQSGNEFARYLDTRAVGTIAEDLSGLPIEPIVAGWTYRVSLDSGTIDLIFEGENKKIDLESAGEDAVTAFFTAWTGDPDRGQEIAACLADWMDADDMPRALGAESEWYSGRGYLPRNGGLGSADLFLIKGLTEQDLLPKLVQTDDAPAIRDSVTRFISLVPSGATINVNYASRTVLQAIPGMTPGILDTILALRQQSIFTSTQDFLSRLGLDLDSPLLRHVAFDRGTSPALISVARLRNSKLVRSERRTQVQIRSPQNVRLSIQVMGLIERDFRTD